MLRSLGGESAAKSNSNRAMAFEQEGESPQRASSSVVCAYGPLTAGDLWRIAAPENDGEATVCAVVARASRRSVHACRFNLYRRQAQQGSLAAVRFIAEAAGLGLSGTSSSRSVHVRPPLGGSLAMFPSAVLLAACDAPEMRPRADGEEPLRDVALYAMARLGAHPNGCEDKKGASASSSAARGSPNAGGEEGGSPPPRFTYVCPPPPTHPAHAAAARSDALVLRCLISRGLDVGVLGLVPSQPLMCACPAPQPRYDDVAVPEAQAEVRRCWHASPLRGSCGQRCGGGFVD